MLSQLFFRLIDYPAFRRIFWKPVYETIAKIKVEDWQFMNYGYVPLVSGETLVLDDEDEINRYSIQLYHYLVSMLDLSGAEMLEIGSGRGGGARYIKKYLKPKKITGLDIAGNAVRLANERYSCEGLHFIQGNAENLPFADKTFDVVVNVESCHAYGSVPAFLKEVKRVLRPGGYFLCTDMRSPNGMQTLKNNLLATGMQIRVHEDITQNVIRAIELEETVKQKRISDNIPKLFATIFKEFAGVKGSKIYRDLQNCSLVYHRFVVQNACSNHIIFNENMNHETYQLQVDAIA
jgi:ubiquinone/menaquinone biosynthesis C-methylase UbiE